MFKKGGIILGIVCMVTMAMAQTDLQNLLTAKNPNLVNLNEANTYNGQPFVYIQGIKVPEKATNDFEELQIKLFGTKNVRQVTKDTLTFDDTPMEIPAQQDENFSFETPFSRPVKTGFIRHISDFIVMIQLLNRQQISVTEQQVLISTDEQTHWTREIPLPSDSVAQIIEFTQNNQPIHISTADHKKVLTLSSPIPLNQGVNRLTLKYDIQLSPQKDQNQSISLNLTGPAMDWDVDRMSILLLTPIQLNFTTNHLLFGANRAELPEIYTQKSDEQGNTAYQLQRIIPANADIYLDTTFDGQQLDSLLPEKDYTLWWLIIATFGVMIMYWVLNYWWEKKQKYKFHPNKIKPIKNPNVTAAEMDVSMTQEKWQRLLAFATNNHLKNHWEQQQNQAAFAIKTATFIKIAGEITIGSVLILIGFIFAASLMSVSLNLPILLACSVFTICGIIILYILLIRKIIQKRGQFILQQLQSEKFMSGMTTQQVQTLYPFLIIAGQDKTWLKRMMSINPNVVKNTFLTEGV